MPETVAQRAIMSEIVTLYQSVPFKISSFELLIQEIDTGVRSAYTAANTSPVQRAQLEHIMLVEAAVPDVLLPVVDQLVNKTLSKIQDNINTVKLAFWDTEWLGLNNPSQRVSTAEEGTHGNGSTNTSSLLDVQRKWDVLRKTPLKKGMKLRSCRRCGSMMEDINGAEGTRVPWIWTGQKMCVCLGYWMLV